MRSLFICSLFVLGVSTARPQNANIVLSVTALAGQPGVRGYLDGTGAAAQFYAPAGLAVDSAGNLFVADSNNCTIRKITPAGVVTLFAGGPFDTLAHRIVSGAADGTGTNARFYFGSYSSTDGTPFGPPPMDPPQPGSITMAIDNSGNLYVADTANVTIRKVTPAGVVTTLAGSPNSMGSTDGVGGNALFYAPIAIAIDGSGNLFVADRGTIRKITPAGVVSTFAGQSGALPGSADGVGTNATFDNIRGIAADNSGNVYVADSDNQTIRKISPAGVVTTFAGVVGKSGSSDGIGTTARFNNPTGLAVDSSGNLYVADTNNGTIRKITPNGVVSTLAGLAGSSGSADGTGNAARFYAQYGLTVDSAGNVYVSDTNNNTIRKGVPVSNATGANLQLLAQPQSVYITGGHSAVFTVNATGTPAPTYQWMDNGAIIPGATGPSYTISSPLVSDDHSAFSVAVTSGSVTVTSTAATLRVFPAGTVLAPITIVGQPASQTITAGQSAIFMADVAASPAPTYQWTKNGVNIPGATSTSYIIAAAQTSDAGIYALTIVNSADTETTTGATLTVNPGSGLTAPAITTQPAPLTVTVGATATFTVVATGNPAPTYQWKKNGVAITGATTATLILANAQTGDAASYTVTATNSVSAITSNAAVLTVNPVVTPTASRLTGLSTRGLVPVGGELTPGFYMRGSGSKNLIIRAVGPSLSNYGVSGPLSDPKMDVIPVGASTPVLSNNDWGTNTNLPALRAAMPFPLVEGSLDAAALVTLSTSVNAGYTVRMTPNGSIPGGIALAEVYDLDASTSPVQLYSLSTLGFTGTGDNVLTAGFFITGGSSKQLLIRAVGPTLGAAPYNVAGVLADPQFKVMPLGQDTIVASNDNWGGTAALQAAFTQTHDFALPTNSLDAAAIVSLPPGGYTIQVTGVGNTTGTVLVEVYDMDP